MQLLPSAPVTPGPFQRAHCYCWPRSLDEAPTSTHQRPVYIRLSNLVSKHVVRRYEHEKKFPDADGVFSCRWHFCYGFLQNSDFWRMHATCIATLVLIWAAAGRLHGLVLFFSDHVPGESDAGLQRFEVPAMAPGAQSHPGLATAAGSGAQAARGEQRASEEKKSVAGRNECGPTGGH